MCFMKAPSISTQQVATPAPLPEPEDAPKVESVDFGGDSKSNTESATGVQGSKEKGKGSLKINKPKSSISMTGANRS